VSNPKGNSLNNKQQNTTCEGKLLEGNLLDDDDFRLLAKRGCQTAILVQKYIIFNLHLA